MVERLKMSILYPSGYKYLHYAQMVKRLKMSMLCTRVWKVKNVKPMKDTFLIRDNFNFHFVNFPFICNNIPAAPAYGVYVLQLKRYSASLGSPSWIVLSFIETVSQMNTDMIGLYWLQVISFVFAHDFSPCVIWPVIGVSSMMNANCVTGPFLKKMSFGYTNVVFRLSNWREQSIK